MSRLKLRRFARASWSHRCVVVLTRGGCRPRDRTLLLGTSRRRTSRAPLVLGGRRWRSRRCCCRRCVVVAVDRTARHRLFGTRCSSHPPVPVGSAAGASVAPIGSAVARTLLWSCTAASAIARSGTRTYFTEPMSRRTELKEPCGEMLSGSSPLRSPGSDYFYHWHIISGPPKVCWLVDVG